MTTLAAVGPAVWPGEALLARYTAFVDGLSCGEQGKRLRRRAARTFLDAHPDLTAWMARPTPTRLADIRRTGAWPFLSWCFVEHVVIVDVDLLGAKAKGEHFAVWADRHADQVARAHRVAVDLGWGPWWSHRVCANTLPMVCLTAGVGLPELTETLLDRFEADLDAAATITAHARQVHRAQLYGVRQVCFQLGHIDAVPRQAWRREVTLADRAARITQPELRRVVLRYLETIATVLRPTTVTGRAATLVVFCAWLAEHHPEITRLSLLSRSHLEAFLVWNHRRTSHGRATRGKPISPGHATQQIVNLRTFFEDLAAWGWADTPTQTLLHRTDIPRGAKRLPRALPPDVDQALMRAVAGLDDAFARCAITILRGTGLRLGELMDLELDCLWDTPRHGTWLKVPLGKLGNERVVPLDEHTLAAFDDWTARRGPHRALPHPRNGQLTDFLFMASGRRLFTKRIRQGLFDACAATGMTSADGQPLRVTPHQLRHTYATDLANAGMSLQALMTLLGHVTPEMTMRYAALADATVRTAYDDAMATLHHRNPLPLVTAPAPASVPDRIDWLHSEMLKTRVAHGYCSRHIAAQACPYANICEQCDNFVTTPAFLPALRDQLDDTQALHDDANTRGWPSEAARHHRVIVSLKRHTNRLERHPDAPTG